MGKKLLYKIQVKGRVQGVGYRWSTVRAAKNFGVKGYVKNMPDNSVYIEAEGTGEQLRNFVEWCRNGPGHVESVTTDVYQAINYRDFKIVY